MPNGSVIAFSANLSQRENQLSEAGVKPRADVRQENVSVNHFQSGQGASADRLVMGYTLNCWRSVAQSQ